MMKIILLLALSLPCISWSKYECRILLNGENTYPDRVNLDEIKNSKDCIKSARDLFQKNKEVYSHVYIFKDHNLVDVTPESGDVDE